MTQLSGKIVWVTDDFGYYGHYKALTQHNTSHVVTKLTHFVMDENMISFCTDPYTAEGETFEYRVNLMVGNKEYFYSGYANYGDGSRADVEISCEAFEHKKKIMLYGKWIEDEIYHTWWASIDKE